MKIIFFELLPEEKAYIGSRLTEHWVKPHYSDTPLDKDHVPQETGAEALCVFVNCRIDEETLIHFPNLKYIATRSTGFDHIDLLACAKRNIVVSSVPSYGENTVAEFTFALLLALSRKITDAHHQVKETGSFSVQNLRGFDLKGKTMGIIGTGKIGKHVARIARGFEMNIITCDTHPDETLKKETTCEYLDLDELLARSDIVTLHVPSIPQTKHLINKERIAKMKDGAYIINTSRGEIIDTHALIEALVNKKLGGAALDVLEEEGAIKDELNLLATGHPEEHNLKTILMGHALINMPNVIVTPHTAFNTWEAIQRILDTTVENIISFTKHNPINVVKS